MPFDIKQITPAAASVILNTQNDSGEYTLLGLYYIDLQGGFVGIDNSTGDAWTEDFNELDKCLSWLRRE